MAEYDILASTLELDRYVNDFDRGLVSYLDKINECINEIHSLLNDLGRGWSDPELYPAFKMGMEKKLRDIEMKCGDDGLRLHQNLQTYINDFKVAIEELRKGSGK